MSPASTLSLIASPHLSFEELDARLDALGWLLESESQTPPLIEGEPEFAVYAHRTADAHIHYTFNPVVHLRVLCFDGDAAQVERTRALARIPALGAREIERLLAAADKREILLGLLAAGELRETVVRERVRALSGHPDPRIAKAASSVLPALDEAASTPPSAEHVALRDAAEALSAEKAAHPERSVLFARLPDIELRRQAIRCLIRDHRCSTPRIDEVLRAALADQDWEVRVTAVLAAARLEARSLIPEIRRADIPTTTRHGADERDRFIYERLRDAAARYLAGRLPPEGGRPEGDARLLQLVSREQPVNDDFSLLVHALTTPLAPSPEPASLPAGVEARDQGYVLRRSRVALAWVPPVPHWIGEGSGQIPGAQPLRRVQPEAGFFIAVLPLTKAQAAWIHAPGAGAPEAEGDSITCSWDEARRLFESLAQIEGARVALPAADAWEMAARGPDGRRYPWGNGLSTDGPARSSPWSVEHTVGYAHEWTADIARENGAHIACGGPRYAACARRSVLRDDDDAARAAVRLAVALPETYTDG